VLVLMMGCVPISQAQDVRAPSAGAEAKTVPPQKPAVDGAVAKKSAATGQSVAESRRTVPEADDELLEFLGSVDSDTGDEDWLDYLSQTDPAKVAKGDKASKGQKND
jgi:hypothetical protein